MFFKKRKNFTTRINRKELPYDYYEQKALKKRKSLPPEIYLDLNMLTSIR